jgi:hypothetical protein
VVLRRLAEARSAKDGRLVTVGGAVARSTAVTPSAGRETFASSGSSAHKPYQRHSIEGDHSPSELGT